DLRQKVLPLVVGLDLVGIEAFDAGKQTDAAGIAGPDYVLRIGKEITGNQRDPSWQGAFLHKIRQKIELLKEVRPIVAVEVIVDEQNGLFFGVTPDLIFYIAQVIRLVVPMFRCQRAKSAPKVAVTAGLDIVHETFPRQQIKP